MYKTKNLLDEKIRTLVISTLQNRLADSIDLTSQCKQAHWNIKGHSFIALHELFDKIAEDSEEYVDLIAERIMQLGGAAEGTVQVVGERTKLPKYPLNISSGKDHVAALSNTLAKYGDLARQTIKQATEIEDADTADIFTQISRGVDKYLWFVESHFQMEGI